MDRYICIHGHFYQPPRENPWLGAIELQDSAHPYHDWNERITAECYAPNTASRILDVGGQIRKIVNNYSRISFNFGPTLLSWLEENSPDTYAAILAADSDSIGRFSGHGSAIAQAYNHIILPLASERDRRTQVIWGLRDFESRFGRKPEGMWLPEAAVDLDTLESLAEQGLAYTVLAPHQARSVRALGDKIWTDVNGSRIDPSIPYLLRLPSGAEMAIFFYDGPISRAVAFERLLTRGELLADRLTTAFSATRKHRQLVHIATDGETYGHHHHRGDMALAYALDYIETQGLARLTNYGEFLANNPPTHEVEIIDDTSWSCIHGIERWRSDCGCNSGSSLGWTQRWRGPLRESLDWLRDRAAAIYETLAADLFTAPWDARDDYASVVLNPSESERDEFLARNSSRPLTTGERLTAFRLMEMQRNGMLMYTSCGWFFNELSGIETVQILRYAARVIQLARDLAGGDLEPEFLQLAELAKSNLPEMDNGRVIYEKLIRPTMIDLFGVAAHYAVSSLFESYAANSRIYCYEVDRHQAENFDVGRARVVVGRATICSMLTEESKQLAFGVLYLGDVNLTGGVREIGDLDEYQRFCADIEQSIHRGDLAAILRLLDREIGTMTFSIRSLFRDEQRKILNLVWKSTLSEAESAFRQLHDRYAPLIRFHSDLFIPLPKVLYMAVESDLNLRLKRALASPELPIPMIQELLGEVRKEKVTLDEPELAYELKRTISAITRRLLLGPTDLATLQQVDATVSLVRTLPFNVDLWEMQNAYYAMSERLLDDKLFREEEPEDIAVWRDLFDSLGDKLSMQKKGKREIRHHPEKSVLRVGT
ncbi:MAG TPA: DUF3536 domain-containing protein [Thermoanaerobaculia bacterium]|nr:DUF3536 domain-containing protein [Thermoanaerobaculia bacterium]